MKPSNRIEIIAPQQFTSAIKDVVDRRSLLRAAVATMGTAFIGCASQAMAQVPARRRPATNPTSPRRCVATEDNIEGPYYLAGAPVRSDLWTAGMAGTRLELQGSVMSTRCVAVAGATIEVWQADARGQYDESGYALRGAIRTDTSGRYMLRTILPGRYLNGARYRPAHIHIKITARGHRSLTTQLYFANDPYNAGDAWIRESLILTPQQDGTGLHASHDLVLLPS